VAHRSDGKNVGAKISFDDERYLRYVPVRLPWTICVVERLPPGAAGVLINQTHVFNDLYLIVNEEDKRIFEAVDGRRSIEEIAPQARELFEKLWRYDQVVFDTSKS
jgi:hypothetical protein